MEQYKADGYKYFLDVAIMPKQLKQPKPEALTPAYERVTSANKMFLNRNIQFHYYFYIRDIQTGDVFLSTDFEGFEFTYKSLEKFMKQVKKDAGK